MVNYELLYFDSSLNIEERFSRIFLKEIKMAFSVLQKKIFLFVKSSSNPCLLALCSEVGLEEADVRPVVEDLEKRGFIRIDAGKNGREDRVKPHLERPGLLWQWDFMAE